MARTDQLNIRIEPDLRQESEAILKAIGINSADAVRMFFRQVVMHKGLPFSANIPNEETIATLNEPINPEDTTSFGDFKKEMSAIADEVRKQK